ncbi:hypothetical protein CR513_08385, partial [Mucuna pruriens]
MTSENVTSTIVVKFKPLKLGMVELTLRTLCKGFPNLVKDLRQNYDADLVWKVENLSNTNMERMNEQPWLLIFDCELIGAGFYGPLYLAIRYFEGVTRHDVDEFPMMLNKFASRKTLYDNYEEILAQKELIYFQKSILEWLACEDMNNKYFHGTTLIRRGRKVEYESFCLRNVFPSLPFDSKEKLVNMVSLEKVKCTIFNMSAFKVLDPDDLQAIFY